MPINFMNKNSPSDLEIYLCIDYITKLISKVMSNF